jgi:hypothetical protein
MNDLQPLLEPFSNSPPPNLITACSVSFSFRSSLIQWTASFLFTCESVFFQSPSYISSHLCCNILYLKSTSLFFFPTVSFNMVSNEFSWINITVIWGQFYGFVTMLLKCWVCGLCWLWTIYNAKVGDLLQRLCQRSSTFVVHLNKCT